MTKLNALLCEGASRERQGPLKGEMTDIDKRLDSVAHRLNAKLADLEMTIAKWNEYYKRLNNFCDWLNEKEGKLNEVYENKEETPENQLKKSEVGKWHLSFGMVCGENGYELKHCLYCLVLLHRSLPPPHIPCSFSSLILTFIFVITVLFAKQEFDTFPNLLRRNCVYLTLFMPPQCWHIAFSFIFDSQCTHS